MKNHQIKNKYVSWQQSTSPLFPSLFKDGGQKMAAALWMAAALKMPFALGMAAAL